MPQLRDLLARFRPVGSPGAASRVGAPVDRARELSGELEPVLALLAATHAECVRVVAEARQDARQIVDEAHGRAAAVEADAARRAEAARAAAAGEVVAAARDQASAVIRDAAQRARRPRPDVEQRISELVSDAVGLVMALPPEGGPP